jgi:hypothetical protein
MAVAESKGWEYDRASHVLKASDLLDLAKIAVLKLLHRLLKGRLPVLQTYATLNLAHCVRPLFNLISLLSISL